MNTFFIPGRRKLLKSIIALIGAGLIPAKAFLVG